MRRKITFLNFLRIWLGFVAVIAIGSTIQCFINPTYLFYRVYNSVDESNGSALTARLFGVWTLLSGGLRLICALVITNKMLYLATFFSFLLAFGHFASEYVLFKTATLTAGIISPLIVSITSMVLMSIGLKYINDDDMQARREDENAQILKGRSKKFK